MWADTQVGLIKFCKSIMAALAAFHVDTHGSWRCSILPAGTVTIADAVAEAEAACQHQGALQQANLEMGLILPG